jgi:predicted ATP-binding protein involved in virulence
MQSLGGGVNPQPVDGGDDYHFKFKISIVGDSGVGKTAFLDAISNTLGTVVENEHSSELHIKTTYYVDDAY